MFLCLIAPFNLANAEADYQHLKDHVLFLSSDTLKGRLTGTKGEQIATEYIAQLFQQAGLEPAGDNGTFFQEFDVPVDAVRNSQSITTSDGRFKKQNQGTQRLRKGRNVLARLSITPHARQMIIVGAHLDHLGLGTHSGSRARGSEVGMIHPGADDNASGVACVLELARTMSALRAQGALKGDKDILFAAWSGEEWGVLGSTYFVSKMEKAAKKNSLASEIAAVLNLDMVGHLKEHLVLQGVGSSPDWLAIIQQVNTQYALSVVTQSDPYLPTDTTPFYLHEVPILNFFTGAHDDYHTPRDRADTLNVQGIKKIADFLYGVVTAIALEPKNLAYRKVAKSAEGSERRFKIYLGTIPDYTGSDVIGVRISGVAKNSPAERAGIQSHDVLVELAGSKINDIYDYTSILNKLEAGVPVKLLVLRGKHYKTLTISAVVRN